MYTRIVVPLDGSEMSAQALPTALELAQMNGAPLHLVRVVEFGRLEWTGTRGIPTAVFEAERAAAADYLTNVRQTITQSGIEVSIEVRSGISAQELVDAVQPGDLLVMASHGRSGLARWFLGSVAESVVRRAPVPVLLVRVQATTPSAETTAAPATEPAESTQAEDVSAIHDAEPQQDLRTLPVGLGLGIGVTSNASEVLGAFDLADEIGQFTPGEAPNERRAETLVKTDRLRVVLVTMREGATLHEHSAPGPITIHTLRGRFGVRVGDEERELAADGLIAVASGVRHAVRAIEDGAFLLTIAWPAATPEVPDLVVSP